MDASACWPASYVEGRNWFRSAVPEALRAWQAARLESQPPGAESPLTIDWVSAPANCTPQRLLVLLTGLHGIEGFVGDVMLRLFVEEVAPLLDAGTTGLLLIRALNAWGMQHGRKANAQNVDLNRNFLLSPQDFDPAFNPDYRRLKPFLGPERPVDPPFVTGTLFLLGLARTLAVHGAVVLRRASLLGQYGDPRGMYYGGAALTQEAQLLLQLLHRHVPGHASVAFLDMHSGYGPRFQMSLVHSSREPRSVEELRRRFGYPRILKADDRDFYSMQGDMVDALYALAGTAWPGVRFYASAFEFGTFGESTLALARSLRAMILENQLHHYGARSEAAARWVRREFTALYRPQQARWWEKARSEAHQAFLGILHAEGFLSA